MISSSLIQFFLVLLGTINGFKSSIQPKHNINVNAKTYAKRFNDHIVYARDNNSNGLQSSSVSIALPSFVPSSSSSSMLSASISSSSSGSSSISSITDKTNDIMTDKEFTEEQLDFTKGYINKHHSNILQKLVIVFSEIGKIHSRKNAFSGGSYKIEDVKLIDIKKNQCNNDDNNDNDFFAMVLNATVQERTKKKVSYEIVQISLDSNPIEEYKKEYTTLPLINNNNNNNSKDKIFVKDIYAFVRKLNRLCNIIREPSITGKLIQLAIQMSNDDDGNNLVEEWDANKVSLKLHNDLYLNQVPHNRYVRNYFYDMASYAALQAVIDCADTTATNNDKNNKLSNRMKIICMFPELNPDMDSYRIGTLLELVRSITLHIVEQTNLRVRVCVQQSMGVGIFTGTPKQLNGVATLLQRMDWLSGDDELNEGILGNYVNFGGIGKDHVQNTIHDDDKNIVQEQDDIFIIICPQSMVGTDTSIIPLLQEMVDAAGDRPVILINPDLTDKVSSQGQQNVRGRQQRIDFADSFQTIFQFQNIYVSGTSYFPILGAVGKFCHRYPYVAYQRRDWIDNNIKGEIYVPVLSSEDTPSGEDILKSFQ